MLSKRSFFRLLGLLFLLFLVPQTTPSENTISAQDDETDAPWLYYYSVAHDGFVLERADGSELRVLGNQLLSDVGGSIGIWSYTGDWIYWRLGHYPTNVGQPAAWSTIYAMKTDSSQEMTLFSDATNVYRNTWMLTPDGRDALLVIQRDLAYTGSPIGCMTLSLVDVESSDFIAVHDDFPCEDGDAVYDYDGDVSPDGQWVIVYTTDNPRRDEPMQIFLMRSDGSLHQREFQFEECQRTQRPNWLQDGRLFYTDSRRSVIIIEDLETGGTTEFQLPFSTVYDLSWSPDEHTAIVRGGDNCDYEALQIFLISLSDTSLQYLGTDQTMVTPVWKPVYWSPSGEFAIVEGSDKPAYLFASEEMTLEPIQLPVETEVVSVKWFHNQPMLLATFPDIGYYQYDLVSEEWSEFPYVTTLNILEISPDDTTIIYESQCGQNIEPDQYGDWPICIENMITGDQITVGYLLQQELRYPGFHVAWYNDTEWLILADEGGIGGSVRFSCAAVNINEGITLDFGTTCPLWLPDHIAQRDPLPGIPICNAAPPPQFHVRMRGIVSPDNENRLNLRDIPGGNRVAQLDQGTRFTIIGTAECHNELTWWQIETDAGEIGWLAEGIGDDYFILPEPETPISPTSDESTGEATSLSNVPSPTVLCTASPPSRLAINLRARVAFSNGDDLLVRSEPGGELLTRLPEGTPFTIIGGHACANDLAWWEIETDDGTTGWVAEGIDQLYFFQRGFNTP